MITRVLTARSVSSVNPERIQQYHAPWTLRCIRRLLSWNWHFSWTGSGVLPASALTSPVVFLWESPYSFWVLDTVSLFRHMIEKSSGCSIIHCRCGEIICYGCGDSIATSVDTHQCRELRTLQADEVGHSAKNLTTYLFVMLNDAINWPIMFVTAVVAIRHAAWVQSTCNYLGLFYCIECYSNIRIFSDTSAETRTHCQ